MDGAGSLGQRLRWARMEQGITLQQLSDRCGRAVSYLCQLELGNKENPTRQTVDALAAALNVRPAFLFGEVSGPRSSREPAPAPRHPLAAAIGREFRKHAGSLPEDRRWELTYGDSGERFRAVVRFLLERFPEEFNPLELAYQLGMSLGQFCRITDCGEEASHPFMEQICAIAGVPLTFLTHGSLDPVPACPEDPYARAVGLARSLQVTPAQLESLILNFTRH